MKVLVVTNDSTVFLHSKSAADKMFGGRVTEIRRFCKRLSEGNDVTFSLISGEYGFLTEDDIIESYERITDNTAAYRELQQRMDFVGKLSRMSGSYDVTLIFVPKEMMRLILDTGSINGKVISVTSPEFKEEFERRKWSFYERRGARIGKKNSENIIAELSGASAL